MAASPVTICNLALAHLGEAPIASLEEATAAARACNLHYAQTRDMILRSHRWNFAQARVVLTVLATAPVFGWDYQYELPADCLRALELNDSEIGDTETDHYIIEGRRLLTDSDTVNLVYLRQVADTSEYDSLFVEAFALKLAIKLSESVRGTTEKTGELAAMYERITAPLARRVDANEGRRRKGLLPIISNGIRARLGEG